LEKAVGVETVGSWGSSDGKDGTLALGGNVTGLSEYNANSRSDKERAGEEHG